MGPGFESLKVHQTLEGTKKNQCFYAEGPPVPIPNTEVKLCSAENTCPETDREDRSTLIYSSERMCVVAVAYELLWQKALCREDRASRLSYAEGPPVPIPNTEVKLCSAENTCSETNRKDRS